MSESEVVEEETLDPDQDPRFAGSSLAPFGYNLFAGSPTTFAPVTEIPVPSDYRLGPGDNIRIQLYGNRNENYNLTVSRDGTIDMPSTGPKMVTGMSFDELRSQIQSQISHQFIGTQANITLGELRSIRVFVLGEARSPGAYTVSSLSTITNALFVSGGVTPTGSLRHIQHKRNGEVVGKLDLYDLLLHGDTSNDSRLLPGDVIFIPPVETMVGIRGEVQRPALYELKGETTAEELVELAGGFTPEAFPRSIELLRIDPRWRDRSQPFDVRRFTDSAYRLSVGGRLARILDLTRKSDAEEAMRMGDLLTVGQISDLTEGAVELRGATHRTGRYAWQQGMRVSDLITDLKEDLTSLADSEYAVLIRETPDLRSLLVYDFNLRHAVEQKDPVHNLELLPDDRIRILTKAGNQTRKEQLNAAANQLRNQTGRPVVVRAQIESAESFVTLTGAVVRDGRYPWYEGLRVSDLLHDPAIDLPESADLQYALVVRQNPDRRTIHVRSFNPKRAIKAPDSKDNQLLNRRDEVIILSRVSADAREAALQGVLAKLQDQTIVSERAPVFNISGAVRFPGRYPLTEPTMLADAFRAAGGLLENALVSEGEIVRMTQDEYGITDSEILSFNTQEVLAGNASISLQERDQVLVKSMPDFNRTYRITLGGEVLYPGTYSFRQGDTLKDVVERAGGLTNRAFPEGAVFTRERLRNLERQRLAEAERRLRADLAKMALEGERIGQADREPEELERIADQLGEAQAVGRLVIDLKASLAGVPSQQIILNDGDRLFVPPVSQAVSVFGEVQFPSSHLYQPGMTIDNYLERSGGPTRVADVRKVYIIHADGSVTLPRNSRWFTGFNTALRPGDTIVMPINIDRINQMELLTNVTQVLSQLAFSAAALNSL
jgi:protein involved in polysaccharide export with SLBB domain